jgi:hypothetical protein
MVVVVPEGGVEEEVLVSIARSYTMSTRIEPSTFSFLNLFSRLTNCVTFSRLKRGVGADRSEVKGEEGGRVAGPRAKIALSLPCRLAMSTRVNCVPGVIETKIAYSHFKGLHITRTCLLAAGPTRGCRHFVF